MENVGWALPTMNAAGGCGGTFPEPLLNNLVLIGTVHGDPRGYARVRRLLEWLRPEVVTVEISRFSLRYRRAWEEKWQRQLAKALTELPRAAAGHPALKRVAGQIALPCEYRAARDYSREQGIKCLPLDLGGLSRRHLPQYQKELLSPANLRALMIHGDDSPGDPVAREFARARLVLARPGWRLPHQASPETRCREFYLSRRLRRLAATGARVVHLGGWEHLVPWRDGDGFLAWLAGEKPEILLADAADQLPAPENDTDNTEMPIWNCAR